MRDGIVRRDHAELRRKFRREHHADRHPLAVEQAVGEAGRGFQRMAEGVAEIEQRALAGLALVADDDRRPWRGSEVAIACSRAAPPANRSAWLVSSQAKNASSPRMPYFATSA